MPLAKSRLEILQVRKLIQCVRDRDVPQIEKMAELGLLGVLDFQDPDSGDAALHVACTLNHDILVQKLLELGASTHVQSKGGLTPAMVACQYGHLQSLQYLASRGLAPAVVDSSGKPVTFHCLDESQRHAKCLEFVLQACAETEPSILADTSGTPLMCAVCEKGYVKLLDRLVDGGVEVNCVDPARERRTPVALAAEGGHHECVNLLLQSGADPDLTFGVTELGALHRAAAMGHFLVIQALSAYGADFNLTASTGENALHFATKNYRLLCIRMLAQRGCPANEGAGEEDTTPQKIAKVEGFKDAMKELKKLTTFQDKVAHGTKPKGYAEPWAVRFYDWLIVNKLAVKDLLKSQDTKHSGSLPVDKFFGCLLDLGAPLEEEDKSKLLAIYDKKGEGSLSYADLLEEHKYIHAQYKLGPDDNIKAKAKKGKKGKGGKGKKGGKTKILFPIYYEAEPPPVSGVTRSVIEKELYVTDFQRFDRDSATPHHLVDDSPWYLPYPEKQYMKLYEAVRHGNLESIQSALATGLSVDCRDKFNKTPLMVASGHGRVDVVEFLLERGTDVAVFDNFHWTALHHACHSGQLEVVKLLLEAGADINAQGVNGGTPLMRAIQTSQKETVIHLLDRGANVTLENKHGETALEVAKNWGDDYIYAVLYAKASSLPPPPEKKDKDKDKGKGKDSKKGGKKGGKGKKKSDTDNSLPDILPGPPLEPLPPPPRLPTPAETMEGARKRASLGVMQASTHIKPSSTYRPRPAWVSRPPSTVDYMKGQMEARQERGTLRVDFGELQTPFQLQMLARIKALEVTDA